jgi:hypothetical protein
MPAWSASCEMDHRFSIVWEQPEDADRTWTWDASCSPLPLRPISIDHAEALYAGIDRERRLRP